MDVKEYLALSNKCPWHTKDCDSEDQCERESDKEKIREYNKELIKKYPWLEPTNRWSGKRITACASGEKGYWPGEPDALPEYGYDYTELDEMPDGWRIAFGEQMCEDIEAELEKFDYQNKYTITQIKEKYGYLHWYDNGVPVGKLSEDYEIVKTDDWNAVNRNREDDDHYVYIGKDDDENHTLMYKHYKILDKCKVWDIIHKYEKLSENTCIMCGKPAKWETVDWISPYCDACKHELETKDFYDSFVPIDGGLDDEDDE